MTKKSKSILKQVEDYNKKTELKRHDLSNGRWYENKRGVKKISATSFNSVLNMGPGYDKWLMTNGFDAIKIRDEKAKIGTIVHAYIDMLISGEEVNLKMGLIDDNGEKINFGGIENESD